MASQIQSATELHEGMVRLARQLHAAVTAYEELAVARATTEHEFELAKAKAYLVAEGTVDARKAQVTINTATESISYRINDAMEMAARKKLDAMRSELSALQSVASAYRAEAELVGRGPR